MAFCITVGKHGRLCRLLGLELLYAIGLTLCNTARAKLDLGYPEAAEARY